MKQLIMFIASLCLACTVNAQSADTISSGAIIPACSLNITWHKTTLLIFPSAIQSADRGDQYVLAEKVEGVDNVLKVKAGQQGFDTSNLQVITKDGKVYSFDVHYSDQPAYQTVDLRKQHPAALVEFSGISLNSRQLEDYAAGVAGGKPFIKRVHQHQYGIDLRMDGIYIKNDVLFFRYRVKNGSAIRYDAASLRFYIRDKKKAKRTAEQDQEIKPLYVQHTGIAETYNGQVIVAAFAKFTIAESKKFITEIMEQGGDRNPACNLDQSKLLKAKPLY